jgi:type 2 lantibiotic biosynthesis protein LanM
LGAARLREGLAVLRARHSQAEPLASAEVEGVLVESLAFRLHELASRVLILELNVARVMGQLSGSTPHERFHDFSTVRLREPEVRAALLREYPVLARLMLTTLERWLDTCLELLGYISVDQELLERTFLAGGELGTLVALQGGISDVHKRGRGVFLLRFSSGLKLVYKPKSLAVDVRFQELLQWLNAQGLPHSHRVLTVLDRGSYGWVEFVESSTGCDSREALQRFYWRQGSFLALLHLLSAVDFHLENLIASGEFPVLVDLEALFHHRAPAEHSERARTRAWELLDQSIVSVGMVPIYLFGREGKAGVDMSGLGGESGQLTPQRMPTIEDPGRDTMRVVRRQGLMGGSNNRPRLGEAPVDPSEFTEELVQGFEETYALLSRLREPLAPRLRAFAEVEVRYIARATQRYGVLLQESHHPDFLRDGLERDKVLDHLWAEVAVLPALRRLLPFEHADLRLGDIPFFTARPGQRHVWSSTGECIPDYFTHDSLSDVLTRLERMNERDCALQVSFIRKAMVSLDKGREVTRTVALSDDEETQPEATAEECLAAAVAIGERLAAQAVRGSRDACWIGLNLEDLKQWRWSLSPIAMDLYEGMGGLALFFGYLARRAGRADFEELARATLEPVREDWRRPSRGEGTGVGVFVGRGSAVYVLGHLATLWNEPALMDELLEGLPALEAHIDTDVRLDLLSGVAGLAAALVGLYRRTGNARLLEVARRCGERLVATAVATSEGAVGWKGEMGSVPLAGFSHGAAGICWALLELAEATGDSRYQELAHQGLAYERSLFVPERGNWKDLRVPGTTDSRFMAMWCHGAAGVALGRVLALRHLEGPEVREELATALETTLRSGFGGNHCLCHGDVGNLEVLHVAGTALAEPRWTRAALRRAAVVLREGREDGWRCGLPRRSESPGLFMGLAGIGYGLLRLSAPEQLPSLLSLEAPR